MGAGRARRRHPRGVAVMTTPDPAATLLRLINGGAIAQAVAVAARLGLADLLAAGASAAGDLAVVTGTHAPSLHRLLRALAALGVAAEEADGRFTLGPLGNPLRENTPGSVRPLLLLFGHADFWASWGALEHCIRTGETATHHLFGMETTFERYAADPALGAIFHAGMTVLATRAATAVVAAYDIPAEGLVVDVGGGEGALLSALLQAQPRLRGIVFDLPEVAQLAARALAAAGLSGRAEAEGGDIFAGVPAGGDLYLLKSVLHDWDDTGAVAVLRACRAAMTQSDARLLVIERLMPARMVADPVAVAQAVGDLMMLVRAGGRERTAEEFEALLSAAELRLDRVLPTASHLGILECVAA